MIAESFKDFAVASDDWTGSGLFSHAWRGAKQLFCRDESAIRER